MDDECVLLAPPGGCRWCGDPLPAGRRRWCSTGCADAYRVEHSWPYARAAALARDGWACVVCGDGDLVEVHHDPPAPHYGTGCHHHRDRLTTLCRRHHRERHGVRGRQLTLV